MENHQPRNTIGTDLDLSRDMQSSVSPLSIGLVYRFCALSYRDNIRPAGGEDMYPVWRTRGRVMTCDTQFSSFRITFGLSTSSGRTLSFSFRYSLDRLMYFITENVHSPETSKDPVRSAKCDRRLLGTAFSTRVPAMSVLVDLLWVKSNKPPDGRPTVFDGIARWQIIVLEKNIVLFPQPIYRYCRLNEGTVKMSTFSHQRITITNRRFFRNINHVSFRSNRNERLIIKTYTEKTNYQ